MAIGCINSSLRDFEIEQFTVKYVTNFKQTNRRITALLDKYRHSRIYVYRFIQREQNSHDVNNKLALLKLF